MKTLIPLHLVDKRYCRCLLAVVLGGIFLAGLILALQYPQQVQAETVLPALSAPVIDGATNLTTTVTAGTEPYAVAINPVTNKVYVANYGSAYVTVIDGATNTTITITAGISPTAVAVNPVTDKI
jgi:YVTN family beta-propeller protein